MTTVDYRIRPATVRDLPALIEALAWAIEWRSSQLSMPAHQIVELTGHGYLVEDWGGRAGDTALIAEVDNDPVGCAWYRFWDDAHHSYGYVDPGVPELGAGVIPQCRGAGVGTALITELLTAASTAGVARVSLSVESDNPALRLYERVGFRRVERVANSWTMMADTAGSNRVARLTGASS